MTFGEVLTDVAALHPEIEWPELQSLVDELKKLVLQLLTSEESRENI
jgi:hypothetical protein